MFISVCGPELEGKSACRLVKEGPADGPGPAGVGLKPPADIHTAAAGLIACLSSLKGKAAALFVPPPPSAFTAERFSLIPKCCFSSSGSASLQLLGLFSIFQCSGQIQQNVLIPACCLHLALFSYASNDSAAPQTSSPSFGRCIK